jgi:hypothetical protein
MQYRPGYPQTSTAIQEEIWIDVSKRVDYQSLQWEQQATEQNTALRFDIFTMLSLSTTRYDDYASWGTSGNGLDAYTQTSLGMVDAINDPSFFIDIANRTEVKVQEWALVSGHYEVVRTLWGGVVSSVDTERQGDAFVVQRIECADYTALLDELIIRDYNAPTVSAVLGERPTISGLTTEVIAGGLTLTAGPYTFRVVAYNASNEIVEIFTHVSQNLTATDIDPPGISDPELRTIRLNWSTVAGATYYKVFAKSGIGVKDMYYKATVTSPTATYSLSTAPAVAGDLSPEDKVQKGSIDVDIISGSSDPANANYKGIFNGLDPDLDPGIDNQTAYVETAKKLNDGTPDPDKSYRFSPTLETGIVLTSPFGGKTLKQALNIIIEKTGGVFWVDANKDLHYTNKQARELVENPRFESSPASSGYSVAGGHSILQDRGPYGYGRALVASSGATTAESQTSAIPVTANQYYFARVKGWAKTNFSLDWDAELRFYSNVGGTTQVGSSYKLERNISFDSTDDGRWCKAWAMARAGATAVTARIVFMKKRNGGDEVAWTDFSVVKVTGSMGFSDSPSETAYALPMRTFETPKAPRSASKVANRLLVYGVYKDANNPSELESVETDISLTLRKVAAGTLAAAKYYVRVVATVGTTEIICKYATETITDQDVIDGNRELYASWAAVTGASSYKIYVGTKRFAMRLKATQAGTTLSIQSPAAGGAAISLEPSVYYYKVFDFAPGIWEAGGKIIEAAINDSLVDNDDKASTRALSFWEEKGIAERTWEFDTFETEVPMVGEVIPFVWVADDTAEPLMVKGIKAKLLGDRVYYTVTVGDDPLLTKRGVTQIFADMQAATARLNDTIAPEAPQSLAVTAPVEALLQTPDGVTRASVTAQWTPSPEDDFAHYSVEYGYDPNFTEVQRANVSQTSDSQSASTGVKANVVHTFQAEPGRTLYYRVAAIDNTNNKSPWSSEEIELPQDETPCEAPYNVLVAPGLKSNTVTWQFDFYSPESPLLNTENTDFARFRVYRRVHNTGAYAVIAETSATQYVDTDFANYSAGYNYAVTSLDRTGNESGTPGSGGATGVAYNATSSVPSRIDGGVDITTASISGAQIANATITDANIDSINADKITAGTITISTGMTIVSDGTATAPQFEVDKDGITIRDDAGNIVLQVNGSTATLDADFIDVSGITADELTVGAGENVVRVGTNASPAFSGIWAGQSNPSEAPFTVSTNGAVSAKNITVFGGKVLIGELGPSIDAIALAATTGVVNVTTTSAYNADKYTVGARILVDTAGTYGSAAWANGYFVIASTPTSTTFTYESGDLASGPLSDASATGFVYLGSQMAVGGDGGSTAAWMTVEGNKFALKNPADPNENVIEATTAAVTINADFINAGAINIGSLDNNALTATNFSVTNAGVVTAGSGNNVAVISPTDAVYRLWLGHSTGSAAPFSVTSTGAISATSGAVGGWTLSSTSLTGGNTIIASAGDITLGTGENVARLSSSNAAYRLWLGGSTASTAPFRVTSTGEMTATSASITGTVSTNNITATGGFIGGWSLTSTSLTNYGGSTGQYAGILDTDATGLAFFAGATTSTGTGAQFSVTNAGLLTASGATISGAITATSGSFSGSVTATSGSIGGWAVDSARIYNALASNPYIAGLQGSSTSNGIAFFAGATSSSGASALYSVTNAGALTASSGTIGGFTLSSTSLTAGTGASAVGLLPGTFPFFAGSDTASSAPFRVTSAGALTATDVTIVGTNETINSAITGKLSLQPSASQAGSTILIDGTITFSGSLSASRPDNSRTVTVTGYSGAALVVGMFITTTSAQGTFVVANAKILTVVGTTFTFESQSALATINAGSSSGTITAFTAYKSLQFLGGGVTRFQQTATSPGALAAGSLILGNNTGLNNIGTALLVIPADGELVFNSTVSNPAYDGGANLYSSNGTSTLNTSGNFTVGGTLTATTISATDYGLAASDIPTLTLGTDTAGNYVASVTSANSLISVSGTGAGASVVLTGDLTPTFTTITVSGAAEFDGAVTLGDTTADSIRFLNMFQTTTITNSFNPRVYNASGTTPWRIFYDTSSERFKTNIVYMEDTDAILDVKPVSYHDKTDYETNGEESPRQYGFLAEEMAANSEGIAFVVNNGADAETIQYDRLVVPLHSSMRRLRSRIQELEARIALLENA